MPTSNVPPNMSGRTPNRSMSHPVIGPMMPPSALDRAKGRAVAAWDRPRLWATGRKKTLNPCQWMLPPNPFVTDDAATIHQP